MGGNSSALYAITNTNYFNSSSTTTDDDDDGSDTSSSSSFTTLLRQRQRRCRCRRFRVIRCLVLVLRSLPLFEREDGNPRKKLIIMRAGTQERKLNVEHPTFASWHIWDYTYYFYETMRLCSSTRSTIIFYSCFYALLVC